MNHPSFRPAAEILESRIAPAALNASFNKATGLLTLDGVDNDLPVPGHDDNYIAIFPTGPRTFRVQGGSDFDFVGVLKDIVVNGNRGEDQLEISDFHALRSITFQGGEGSDSVILRNVTVQGDVFLDLEGASEPPKAGAEVQNQAVFLEGISNSIGGHLVVTSTAALAENGGGGVQFQSDAHKTVIKGEFYFGGSVNRDSVIIGGVSFSVGRDVWLGFESGADRADIFPTFLSLGKDADKMSLGVASGADPSVVEINGAKAVLAGSIEFSSGAGGGRLLLGSGQTVLGRNAAGQSVSYAGGTGADTLTTVESATFDEPQSSFIAAGSLEFDGGGGTDTLQLSMASLLRLGKNSDGESLAVAAGAAGTFTASLFAPAMTFGGAVAADFSAIAAPGAPVKLTLLGDHLSIGKMADGNSVNIQGGAGDDALRIQSSLRGTLAGAVEMAGGGGVNALKLIGFGDGLRIGRDATGRSLHAAADSGGTLNVEVYGHRVDFSGAVETAGGNAGNSFAFFPDQLTVGKSRAGASMTMVGGSGDDSVQIGYYSLQVSGGIDFHGADGDDSFYLKADGQVLGKLSVDLGPAPLPTSGAEPREQSVTLSADSRLGSKLELKGAVDIVSATPASAIEDGGIDSVTFANVSAAKAVNISLGNGGSSVDIDNFMARTSFALTTGSGVDFVNIEANFVLGVSALHNTAIHLGDNDDTLYIGWLDPKTNKVLFSGTVLLDGGGVGPLGFNSANDIVSANAGVKPDDIQNFTI